MQIVEPAFQGQFLDVGVRKADLIKSCQTLGRDFVEPASTVWLSFAEKEFDPEFEIALSEDLFDRPCFNGSASERID